MVKTYKYNHYGSLRHYEANLCEGQSQWRTGQMIPDSMLLLSTTRPTHNTIHLIHFDSAVVSLIIADGEHIDILVFTDHKNNRFQKKLIDILHNRLTSNLGKNEIFCYS